MLNPLLGLGFVHGALGLFCAFGPGCSAFLALFLLQLFASEQFDERRVSAVAFSPSGANDAQVSAFTVPETRSDGVEKPGDRCLGHQVRARLAAGGKVSALAESNPLFYQ